LQNLSRLKRKKRPKKEKMTARKLRLKKRKKLRKRLLNTLCGWSITTQPTGSAKSTLNSESEVFLLLPC